MKEIIDSVRQHVKDHFQGEGTGHDWYHINRVVNVALRIGQEEGANPDIVELGALLHDIADHKFHNNDITEGPKRAKAIILEFGGDEGLADAIATIVTETSFKGAGVKTPVSSIESAVVQDADRLDAIGAIGIARTFAYGGSKGQPLHDPQLKPRTHNSFEEYATTRTSTINHFHEKLLLLKDRMNTDSGRKMAEERHQFMEEFFNRFFEEWDGNKSI